MYTLCVFIVLVFVLSLTSHTLSDISIERERGGDVYHLMYNRGTNFKEGTRKRGREGKGRRKAVDKQRKGGKCYH